VIQVPEDWYIYFYDETGKQIASVEYVSVPFYKGMVMTIHGISGEYKITDWRLHYGHADEKPGLHVTLGKINS
jgi:hypothetical protein